MPSIQAVRGMNDILPDAMAAWHYLERALINIAARYGYQEIRMPMLEKTELFARSIGEVTDIVEKEMYTFDDRNQDSLTLRPEGTASCVRAAIEHGLLYNQTQRLWYLGPIFRHERPQRGRYRQFYQFGVEAFGFDGPDIDAELILMMSRLWQELGIQDDIELQLNSLGSVESRARYREVLVEYFKGHESQLDADSKRRLHTNPMRILDSKNPDMAELIAQAPSLLDYCDDTSQSHFTSLQQILEQAGVRYTINPRLVRGLDYYTDTVFEWVTTFLGAQGTVCAGGRYDGLVKLLGGQETPAIGFAMGCERVIELMQQRIDSHPIPEEAPDVYIINVGEKAAELALTVAESLRSSIPSLKCVTHLGGGSFKSQFKKADKSGASFALILGDNEVESGTIAVKFLRSHEEQRIISLDELTQQLQQLIANQA